MCAAAVGPTFRSQRDLERSSLQQTIAHFESEADADLLSELMFAHWRQPSLFEDARLFLSELDRPVCVVSNIDRDDIESAISHHRLPVDLVVTSEDVRSYKPRPECFLAGLEKLDLRAGQALHVGDSLTSDVEGARALGIPTVWVNREGKPLPDPQINAVTDFSDITIESLRASPRPDVGSSPDQAGFPSRRSP